MDQVIVMLTRKSRKANKRGVDKKMKQAKSHHKKKTDEDNNKESKKCSKKSKEKSLDEQLKDYIAHLQRLQAEFDNFRKRTLREKQVLREYVMEEFAASLFPVLDNFKRAMDLLRESQQEVSASFIEGIEMIFMQFNNILEQHGVFPIKAIGEDFNPAVHEAVGTEDSEEKDNTILKELQTGYRINERVIRPSAVIVAKKVSEEEDNHSDSTGECAAQTHETCAEEK